MDGNATGLIEGGTKSLRRKNQRDAEVKASLWSMGDVDDFTGFQSELEPIGLFYHDTRLQLAKLFCLHVCGTAEVMR